MMLIERDHIIAEFRQAERSARRSGRSMFVAGRAGEGKTTVARHFAEISSLPVWWGACDALTTPRALGPWQDMASEHQTVRRILDESPSTSAVLDEVLDCLDRHPTLVIVEDLHWADEATLDLMLFLGRRVDRTHSLIVATYRHDEIEPISRVGRVLADLATVPNHHRVVLEPLTLAAVSQLSAGQAVDPARLHHLTGGNAFYVSEVLATPGWTVPSTVVSAVLTRVGRLGAEAQSVVETLSVEPRPVDVELFDALGLSPDAVHTVTTSGVLSASTTRVEFRHELARLAIFDQLDPLVRRRHHGTFLAALTATDTADPATLAHHARGCGDDEALLRWSRAAAGEATRAKAHRQAERHLANAVAAADRIETISPRDLIDLLDNHARELAAIDRQQEVVAARERILEVSGSLGDRASVAAATAGLARAVWRRGDGDHARTLADQAVALAASIDDAGIRAVVFAHSGAIAMLSRQRHRALTHSNAAVDAAELAGLPEVLVSALNSLGSTRMALFGEESGAADLLRSAEIAASINDDTGVASAHSNLGSGAGEIRQYETAEQHLRIAVDYANARDLDANAHYSRAWLSKVLYETGRWDEGIDLALSVIDEGTPESPIGPIMAMVAAAGILTRSGREGSKEHIAEAWRLALRTNDLQRLWPVLAVRAEIAWMASETPSTLASDLTSVLAMAIDHEVVWAVGELSFWCWKLGLIDTPPSRCAEPFGLAISGQHDAAAAEWRRIGCPYELASALIEHGDEAAMTEAVSLLNELGARPLADRARHLMRERGFAAGPLGPRRATAAHPAGLSPRQDDVLRLLVAGWTDREIAESLYISPKTAGHHVSAILSKLGVSSRTEAAVRAIAEGWHEASD